MRTINGMIEHLDPCIEAVSWLRYKTDIKKAWNECDKADWLLWLSAYYIDKKTVVLSTCDCVGVALEHVPKDEDRPRKAISTTRLWVEGKASIKEIKRAAGDARAVTYAGPAIVSAAAVAASLTANTNTAINTAYTADIYARAVSIATAYAATNAAYTAVYADATAGAVRSYAAATDAVYDTAATAAAAGSAGGYTAAAIIAHAIAVSKLQKSTNLKKLASLIRKRITAEMIEESLLRSI